MFSFAKKLVDRFEGHSNEESHDSHFKYALDINNKGYGLRVLSIVPHSQAQEKGLEAWFDFIIRVNGHELPMLNPSMSQYSYNINDDGSINYGDNAVLEQIGEINYDLLQKELTNSAGGTSLVTFDVWNAKGGIIRQVVLELKPPGNEDIAGTVPTPGTTNGSFELFRNTFAELGIAVQSQHLTQSTYIWRILATHPGSPAFQAQLVPYSDYIIGCDSAYSEEHKGLLSAGGESLLSRTVLNYYNYYSPSVGDHVPITFYVYNHDYDVLRPVTLNLSRSWGDGQQKGILGCDVGYGLLHRIPEVVGKFTSAGLTQDLLFENSSSYEYQIPGSATTAAPVAPASTAPPPIGASLGSAVAPPPRSTGTKKKKHVTANVGDLSSYMNEELAKSKEMDVQQPTSVASTPPPPPPPASVN